MKAVLIIFTISLLSLQSFGMSREEAYKVCKSMNVESINDYDDEDNKSIWTNTSNRDISIKSDEELKKLPLHVKQKLIILAKLYVKEGYEAEEGNPAAVFNGKPNSIKSTVQAIQYIRAINEFPDEELHFAYYENKVAGNKGKGDRINWVSFYPGAQVGLIYPDRGEGLQYLAEISDGDVFCTEPKN